MLIVYYSWSGNTRYTAQLIKKFTNADIAEIIPEKPYPNAYRQTVDIAKKEADAQYKPPIKTKIPNLSEYEVIFIGSPNWWGTIASPVRTFLSENQLNGKKIALFMTHEGSRTGHALSDLKKMCPQSEILDPLAIRGSAVKEAGSDIENWLKSLKII